MSIAEFASMRAGSLDAPRPPGPGPALLCASGTAACARAACLTVTVARENNPFRNAASNGPAQDQAGHWQTRAALDRRRAGTVIPVCIIWNPHS